MHAAKKHVYLESLCNVNLDFLLLRPLEDLAEHDVCNLLNLALGQLSEDNDLIQPAQTKQVQNTYQSPRSALLLLQCHIAST